MVRDSKRIKYRFRLEQDSALIPKRFEPSEAIERLEPFTRSRSAPDGEQ